MRLGILGGTFDPPHLGHLAIAQDACARLALDRIVFMPAAVPPHKIDAVGTPPELRLAMVRAAIADNDRFEASDLELHRQGPSYTVDTLRELRRTRPADELFLLLGADQFRELATWREPDEIARLATLVAVPREGITADAAIEQAGSALGPSNVVALNTPRLDISSSAIRRRRASDEPIRYLVPDAVRQIIDRERLYTQPASS